MKHWLIFIITLLLFTACQTSTKNTPAVKKGFITLKNYDLEKNGTIALAGEWEFYWQKLYTSKPPEEEKTIQKVPSDWTPYLLPTGKKPEGLGYASYRLQIIMDKKYEYLAFYLPPQGTAYNVYINQKLIASNGRVATKLSDIKAENRPQTTFFQPTDTLEVIVQIANAHNFRGGMWNNLVLGLPIKLLNIIAKVSL